MASEKEVLDEEARKLELRAGAVGHAMPRAAIALKRAALLLRNGGGVK